MKQKLIRYLTKSFEKSSECQLLQNFDLLCSVGESNFTAVEVYYHATCRTRFYKKASNRASKMSGRLEAKGESDWNIRRNAHKQAFSALCTYIQVLLLKKKR